MALATTREFFNVASQLMAAQFGSWANRVGGDFPAVAVELNGYAAQAASVNVQNDGLLSVAADWLNEIELRVRAIERACEQEFGITWASYVAAAQGVAEQRLRNNLTTAQKQWLKAALGPDRDNPDDPFDDDPLAKRATKRILAVVSMVEAFILYLTAPNSPGMPTLPE